MTLMPPTATVISVGIIHYIDLQYEKKSNKVLDVFAPLGGNRPSKKKKQDIVWNINMVNCVNIVGPTGHVFIEYCKYIFNLQFKKMVQGLLDSSLSISLMAQPEAKSQDTEKQAFVALT
ncbi:hypothetical protein ACJX0J_020215 [Zea mays]